MTSPRRQRDERVVDNNRSAARLQLVAALSKAIARRGLSQVEAARLCQTDQPTLSKVLGGRSHSVTLDKLVTWLVALGSSVEIRVTSEAGSRGGGASIAVIDKSAARA